jgi:hypothetical protein
MAARRVYMADKAQLESVMIRRPFDFHFSRATSMIDFYPHKVLQSLTSMTLEQLEILGPLSAAHVPIAKMYPLPVQQAA